MTIKRCESEAYVMAIGGQSPVIVLSGDAGFIANTFNVGAKYWYIYPQDVALKCEKLKSHVILNQLIKGDRTPVERIKKEYPQIAVLHGLDEHDKSTIWLSDDLEEMLSRSMDSKGFIFKGIYLLEPLRGTFKELELPSFLAAMRQIKIKKKDEKDG